jgi:hypothetical protein
MEPTPETFMEMGQLCSSWSYLEAVTEEVLWGILDADQRLGPLITWRLDMRSRWQLILEHAPKKHGAKEMEELRSINKHLRTVTRDRNIIVHGLVHATLNLREPRPPRGQPAGHLMIPENLMRIPCWTVFRGAEAGKNFPISTKAAKTVKENIGALARRVENFNARHGYPAGTPTNETIEADWPKPLE